MPIKTGNITITARGTTGAYGKYYPKVADWVAHYEQRVVGHLGTISRSRTGAALIRAIAKPITIRPLKKPREVNAFARPDSCLDSIELFADAAVCGSTDILDMGTGMGSPSTVFYTPGTWTPGDRLMNKKYSPDAPGARPDEVLFHELVHAVRQGHGERDRTPMKDDFDRVDEFHAIMICNMYCSERARPLRRNHHGNKTMDTKFSSDAFVFYAWYSELVSKFVSDLPDLSRELKAVRCPFNPIREHFDYQEVLRQIEIDRMTPRAGYE